MSKYLKIIFLSLTIAIPVCIFLFLKYFGSNHFQIPMYYENGVDTTFTDCSFSNIPHTIPTFGFNSLDSVQITDEVLKDRITVIEFSTVECNIPCAERKNQLSRVLDRFNPGEIQLISLFDLESGKLAHELKKGFNATENWHFLAGNRSDVQELMQCGTVMNSIDQVVLIDDQLRIRGYYTATDIEDIDRLILEIKILMHG
ncbi:MAG: hypothetical protein AAFX87_18270 [Bacteroidota bacterium]